MSMNSRKSLYRTLARITAILSAIFIISFLGWCITRFALSESFERGCTTHITLATRSANFDVAAEELGFAISYLEDNNLTEGIVSIFFKNPLNDLGFYYNNLKEVQSQYLAFPKDASELERNTFVKRVESSINSVYTPRGISIYPHNELFFWWFTISIIGLIVFITTSTTLFDLVKSGCRH